MAPRETENNAYAKFWGDKQRALCYVMVFSGVVNTNSPLQKREGDWNTAITAIVSGIVTGDTPVSYWLFSFPRSLCEG